MYKLVKKLSIVSSLTIGVATFCLVTATVQAQDMDAMPETSPPTAAAQTTAAYDYTAKPGDSLTKLVRRSIQLLNQARNTKLDNAAAMYCETNAVQRLGSKLLDVNEKVTVPFSVLQEYIDNAKNLSAVQLSRWQRYANQANFNVSAISPDNLASAQSTVTPPATDQNNNPTEDQPSDQSTNDQANQPQPAKPESSSLAWYWWVLGIAGIGLVYYLAGRRISK